jgi:hypothetical protein
MPEFKFPHTPKPGDAVYVGNCRVRGRVYPSLREWTPEAPEVHAGDHLRYEGHDVYRVEVMVERRPHPPVAVPLYGIRMGSMFRILPEPRLEVSFAHGWKPEEGA